MSDEKTPVSLGTADFADGGRAGETARPGGMVLTGVNTGPHRLRLPPGLVTYYAPPPPTSKLRPLLVVGVLFLVASLAGAVYLVGCKRPASQTVAASTAHPPGGGAEQALKLYSDAKQLLAAEQRFAAMEKVKLAQTLTSDEEILSLVRALERRVEATIQTDQARIQIKAQNWKEAAFHLQKSLALHPTPEAERLFKQANDALATSATGKSRKL